MSVATKILDIRDKAIAVLQSAVPLATRLVFGHAFVLTGLGKVRHFENTVSFFTDLGIPLPTVNAAFIAGLELVGGVALLLGLGTRIFAALLSSTMVVALLTAEREGLIEAFTPGGEKSLTEVVPFVYLLFLTWLVAIGPGVLSIDRLLVRRAPEAWRALVRPVPGPG